MNPKSTRSKHAHAGEPHDPSLTQLFLDAGGANGMRRLTAAFYARVFQNPVLRPHFHKGQLTSSLRLADFLTRRLGGPEHSSIRDCIMDMTVTHSGVKIGREEAHAWLDQMDAAMIEVGLPESVRDRLHTYFLTEAQGLNDGLYVVKYGPLDELEHQLRLDPSLVHRRDGIGRTMLAWASGRWDIDRMRLLLKHGADAASADDHSLYYAANRLALPDERVAGTGREVVEILEAAGADVNARNGVGYQTPLHMAARRGNVSLAEELLDKGAEIDAQDSKGETPLRRAVNCRHEAIIALLLARGADRLKPDSAGVSPMDAAIKAGKEPIVRIMSRSAA